VDWFERIPLDLIALLARICVGTVFLRSGVLKLEGWQSGTTLSLFETEYVLPFLPASVAMYLATGAELSFPVLSIGSQSSPQIGAQKEPRGSILLFVPQRSPSFRPDPCMC
jgi:DoxX